MKLDRTRHGAEAQQAAGTQETQHRHGQGGASGFTGGMHKGVAYRHAPRAHLPAKRNTGPAPRARARPASTAAAGAHHEEDHPRSLADDPWAQPGGGSGGAGAGSLLGSVGGQKTVPGSRGSETRASPQPPATGKDAPAPPPPLRQPPVQEGAALRRSKRPEAELLRTPPGDGPPLSPAALLNAFAALYFHGGAQPASALRLAAKAALARHLDPGTPPMTLADVRATVIAWCETHGRPPALTQAQRNANVLFPLEAFRALSGPRQTGGGSPALLQRALEHHTAAKETSR